VYIKQLRLWLQQSHFPVLMYMYVCVCVCVYIYIYIYIRACGPGQRSGYSDPLRVGRFGDRIPVGARLSVPVLTGPGAHLAFCTMSTGSLFRRESGRGVALATHPHLAPRLKEEWSYTSTPPLGLRGLLQGEIYLYMYNKNIFLRIGAKCETVTKFS
jgi:hypothetical protein